jgi:hypothetical protein
MHGQKINRVQSLSLEHATRTAFCESHGTEIKSNIGTGLMIIRQHVTPLLPESPQIRL